MYGMARDGTREVLHMYFPKNVGERNLWVAKGFKQAMGRCVGTHSVPPPHPDYDAFQVTDVGAKVICIAIKMNLALKLLSLSRNALSDDSKRALYQAWSQREIEGGPAQSGM